MATARHVSGEPDVHNTIHINMMRQQAKHTCNTLSLLTSLSGIEAALFLEALLVHVGIVVLEY